MPLKAVVLCRGGLASAVLASLLGKRDPVRSPRNGSSLPSALREQRGLAPEGYALHLLTITEGQRPDPQAQRAGGQEAAVIAAGIQTSEPAFVARFNQIAERVGKVTELPQLRLLTPLAGSSLTDLIALGAQIGVPLESIWSCSAGFALPCGRCAACLARQAAFQQAGVLDQTHYRVPPVPQRPGRA
jgi:hypothetical protein